VEVGPEARGLELPAGSHAYLIETGTGLRVVGALELAAGSRVTLDFDAPTRTTRQQEVAPAP
jgi:hypothetical protein